MRSNLTLTLIFVVLTGLSAWKFFGDSTEYLDLGSSPAMFDGFRPETVATISVQRAKTDGSTDAQGNPAVDRLVFVKQEGSWIIADPQSPFLSVPVMSSQIVSDILEKLGRVKVTDSNILNAKADDLDLAEKQVDEKSAMRIQCSDANQQVLADIYIGRSAGKEAEGTNEAVEGIFVRKGGTKQIVLFEEGWPLEMEAKIWIDKTRRDLSPDQVTEIEIVGKAEGKKIAVHFKRDGTKGWKAEKTPADVGPLKGFAVTEIINAACRVEAIDILSPLNPAALQQYGLAPKAQIHVIVKTKDDKSHDLFIGKRVEGKQDYYAYVGGQLLFSLAEWDISRYQKEAKEYFDPKPIDVKEAKKPESGNGKREDGAPSKSTGENEGENKQGDAQTPSESPTGDPDKNKDAGQATSQPKADKADEPKADEPKADEPKADEPKADEPKADEPKANEPKADQPKSDQPKTDQPKADEPKGTEPKVTEPKGAGKNPATQPAKKD